jgi:hypothetical protein
MTDDVSGLVTETTAKAKKLLFDKSGKPKGNRAYISHLTLHLLCKPVKEFGSADYNFRWRGSWFGFDPKVGQVYVSDGMLCCAAALMLDATGCIPNAQLRKFAAERLSGDIAPPPDPKTSNDYRDMVIAGWLIRPLVLKGISATRNEATKYQNKGESACSIVSEALMQLGISLSERRLAEVWAEVVKRAPNITKN